MSDPQRKSFNLYLSNDGIDIVLYILYVNKGLKGVVTGNYVNSPFNYFFLNFLIVDECLLKQFIGVYINTQIDFFI